MIYRGPVYGGYKIVEVPPTKIATERTWKERLFTRPWQPLRKEDVTWEDRVETGQVIVDDLEHTLYMNAVTLEEWRKSNEST